MHHTHTRIMLETFVTLDRQVELGSYLFFRPGSEGPVDDLGSVHQIRGWLFVSFMESLEKADIEI